MATTWARPSPGWRRWFRAPIPVREIQGGGKDAAA
ncbi:Uncharacterised protein [Bordetella pertussis]|nr:Uncharacterised protein [Bordetella pertussis]